MHPSNTDAILLRVESLPTLAPVAARLLSLSSADDADFDEIIRLIEADPALTSRLLSLCRRASTGAAQPVSTVRRAVVLLGLEALQAAVLSVQVVELMRRPPGSEPRTESHAPLADGFDADGHWRHALAVASAAELLAERHKDLRINPSEAFTAGLLHDIGKLALAWILPRSYARVLAVAAQRRAPLAIIESELLGIDHHLVGKRLGEHWGLPHALLDPIWLHAADEASISTVRRPELVRLVAAANALAHELHIGFSGSSAPPPPREHTTASARLNPERTAEAAALLHAAVARRCHDLGLGDISGPGLVLDSIALANARLAHLHGLAFARASAADFHKRLLASVASFAQPLPSGAGHAEILARFAAALESLTAPGETLAIHQHAPGAPWSLLRLGKGGLLTSAATLPPPCPDLRALSTDGAIGDAATLATFLTAHLPASLAEINIRALRPLWLIPAQHGSGAALILHDRLLPLPADAPLAPGASILAPLVAVASAALAAAATAEGSRRLGERLALANAQLAREQSDRAARESMARLGELTAGAAHEMNNPLTAVSARAQALLSRLTTPKDRDDAAAIAAAAHQLSDLLTRLHTLARPPRPAPRPCRLADVLTRAVSLGRAQAKPARAPHRADTAEISLSVRPPDATLSTDPALLSQAIAELIANALEAGSATRTPGTAPVRIQAALDGQRLTIAVIDSGPGLSAAAQRHAFDPFFSDKPAGRQTGLGLSLCRATLSGLSGSIDLGPNPGASGGTCAQITLPLAPVAAIGPAHAPAAQPSLAAEPAARAA